MGLKLLNGEMRCISRVVIEPRFRGIGLGRYLVAETLARAGVELVEAMAAMGQVNPFFERAGMRRYEGGGEREGGAVAGGAGGGGDITGVLSG